MDRDKLYFERKSGKKVGHIPKWRSPAFIIPRALACYVKEKGEKFGGVGLVFCRVFGREKSTLRVIKETK